MTDFQKTPLYDWHVRAGAHVGPFGGYQMPLWYPAGPLREHRVVLQSVGLFDTSHMSELLIEGPQAFDLLQTALTRDLRRCLAGGTPLEVGRAAYGFLLDARGHLLDDAIVLMLERETYLLVVNAGMGAAISSHLRELGRDLDVAVSDLTNRLSKLDLQGPAAVRLLREVLNPCRMLDKGLKYFGFAGHFDHLRDGLQTRKGVPLLISRTGYTGEFGFEIFLRPNAVVEFWTDLLAAAETASAELLPCGLAARDSLRTGALLPLSHQDLGDWPCRNHPWDFALPLRGGTFSKNFVGDEALRHADAFPHTYAFAGENGRKVETGAAVILGDRPIGRVLTCATDMAMDRVEGRIVGLGDPSLPGDFVPRGLCCGFLRVDAPLPNGQSLTLRDQRREVRVQTVTDLRPGRSARMPWPAA